MELLKRHLFTKFRTDVSFLETHRKMLIVYESFSQLERAFAETLSCSGYKHNAQKFSYFYLTIFSFRNKVVFSWLLRGLYIQLCTHL